MTVGFGSVGFMQPGSTALGGSIVLAAAPHARLGVSEGQADPPCLKEKLLEENGAEPSAVALMACRCRPSPRRKASS